MARSLLTQKLKLLREEAGYTQEYVSKKLNIRRQSYCNYENDTRTPPIETLILLANMYGVSMDYLLRDNIPFSARTSKRCQAEKELVHSFSKLPEPSQKEVLQFIKFKNYQLEKK